MNNHFLDQFPIELLFVFTVALMLLVLELGFRFGRTVQANTNKAQTAQVRALMGATLGLLAFMLAFTFSNAQTHFENRIQLLIDEAILAKTAFMHTDLAQEPLRSQSRDLLREYVDGRLQLNKWIRERQEKEIFAVMKRAEDIQLELWSLGKAAQVPGDIAPGHRAASNGYRAAVLSLMEIQTQRIQAALVNRIPIIIWLTLYFTAFVSMVVVGYQAGLTDRRSPIATFSMALSFSTVMMLIMDLDRPFQSLFEIDVTVMEQLAVFMRQAP